MAEGGVSRKLKASLWARSNRSTRSSSWECSPHASFRYAARSSPAARRSASAKILSAVGEDVGIGKSPQEIVRERERVCLRQKSDFFRAGRNLPEPRTKTPWRKPNSDRQLLARFPRLPLLPDDSCPQNTAT